MLLIFDCDGVLVDSEPLAMRILVDAMAAQGMAITLETAYREFLGRSLASILVSLHESYGAPLSEATLGGMRSDLYALYRQQLRASPGLPGMLDQLKIPFCVASSSEPERIRLSLDVTGLLPWFEPNIFSATMVENGKPAPDLFLHAAQQLGIQPSRCLVIEDSPAGILAARNAGMAVFFYSGGSHIAPSGLAATIAALGPDAIFDDMHDLPDRLSSWRTEKKAR